MIVDLTGQRISGRYALIQTEGDQWLAHRMKEQSAPRLHDFEPMLLHLGSVDGLTSAQWAFEGNSTATGCWWKSTTVNSVCSPATASTSRRIIRSCSRWQHS